MKGVSVIFYSCFLCNGSPGVKRHNPLIAMIVAHLIKINFNFIVLTYVKYKPNLDQF
jgi:hypothetical protein